MDIDTDEGLNIVLPCNEYVRAFYYNLGQAIDNCAEGNFQPRGSDATDIMLDIVRLSFSRYTSLLMTDLSGASTAVDVLGSVEARNINYRVYKESMNRYTLDYAITMFDELWINIHGLGRGFIDMAREAMMRLVDVIVGVLTNYLGPERLVGVRHSWELKPDSTLVVKLGPRPYRGRG